MRVRPRGRSISVLDVDDIAYAYVRIYLRMMAVMNGKFNLLLILLTASCRRIECMSGSGAIDNSSESAALSSTCATGDVSMTDSGSGGGGSGGSGNIIVPITLSCTMLPATTRLESSTISTTPSSSTTVSVDMAAPTSSPFPSREPTTSDPSSSNPSSSNPSSSNPSSSNPSSSNPSSSNPSSSKLSALIIGVAVASALMVFLILVLAATIITGACMCRRYCTPQIEGSGRKGSKVFSHLDLPHVIVTGESYGAVGTHRSSEGRNGRCAVRQPKTIEELFSTIPELPAVELCDLQSCVEALREDGAVEEYQYVKEIDVRHYNFTAALKCNESKNRYADVQANEVTRVCLLTPSGQPRLSDYINANYIEGYNKQKEYIATQGPLEKTAADFWSMVWGENSRNTVMVTKTVEGKKVKCFKYWPSGGVFLAHSISVVLQEEDVLPDYTIRTFSLTLTNKTSEGGGERREVTQFHFTSWPDHGVPDSTSSMLEFVRRIRSTVLPEDGPIIIHCSAGIGRTGTFVAIDVMLQKMDRQEPLNFMEFVCRMRAQRNYMVQTPSQYMFIHEALLHAYTLSSPTGSASAASHHTEEGGDCKQMTSPREKVMSSEIRSAFSLLDRSQMSSAVPTSPSLVRSQSCSDIM